MRIKAEAILEFGLADGESQNKIVREFREELDPLSCLWRFHPKKIKNRYLFVTRYSNSTHNKRLRKVRTKLKALIVHVEEILEKAEAFVAYRR